MYTHPFSPVLEMDSGTDCFPSDLARNVAGGFRR